MTVCSRRQEAGGRRNWRAFASLLLSAERVFASESGFLKKSVQPTCSHLSPVSCLLTPDRPGPSGEGVSTR